MGWENEKVAPSDIQVVPYGIYFIPAPDGTMREVRNVNSEVAEILNAQVCRLRGKGPDGKTSPAFVDLSHGGTKAGDVVEVFWAGRLGGCRALVTWLEPVHAVVATGEYHSFSPSLHYRGSQLIGFTGRILGGLLRRGELPAIWKMQPVRPVSRRADMARLHARFIEILTERGCDSRTVKDHVASLRAERPDLAFAFDMFTGYGAEIDAAEQIHARVAERERSEKERLAADRQASEFLRLVGKQADEIKRLGLSEFAAAEAFKVISAEHPELAAAYEATRRHDAQEAAPR